VAEAAAGARTQAAPLVSGVVPEYNSAPLIGETTVPGKQPLVFILVLNWNGLADTTECLRSLSLLRYKNKRVVVVDNGSDGEEAIKIETTFPAVTVIRNKENFGYAGGNNVGIRYALRNGADYIWLLNNDTMVPADCLTELVAAGEKHSSVGLLSPLIFSYAPPHAIEFAGSVLRQRSGEQCILTLGEAGEAGSKSGPVLVWGTGLLLKRQVADVVGLLDERYFAYHEDLDYCLRAVAAGFETLVVSEASLYHKRGRSVSRVRTLAYQRVSASKELVPAVDDASLWVAPVDIPMPIPRLGLKPCAECQTGEKGYSRRLRARRRLGCTARSLGILGDERPHA
jgi:GT2 family glycosyltransferase